MRIDLTFNDKTGYTQLTAAQLANIVDSMDAKQYLINQAYFEGENVAIINYSNNKEKTPNNKIPLPFARKAINDVVGYSAKPGLIKYQLDQENEESSIEKYNEIVDNSNLWLTTTEVYQDSGIKGESAELAWLDTESMVNFSQIDREQCQFFYDGSVQNNLIMSVRAYKEQYLDASGNPGYKWYAEVYFPDHVDYYEGTECDTNQTQYNPQEQQKSYVGLYDTVIYDGIQWNWKGNKENAFGIIQLYPYRINSDLKGLFQPLIPIIDRLDMFGTDSIANALDRFNDSVMLMSKKIDELSKDNLTEFRVIDDLGPKDEGNFVEYLKREMDLQSSVDGFQLFERLFYELGSLINMNDDKFNQKSGIAIAYALVPFENMIAQMETYFNQGLSYRMKIINKYLEIFSLAPLTYTINWERNLPFDLASRVDVVVKLKESQLLSDETILKMFPENIVKDAEEEIERRDQEKVAAAEKGLMQIKAFTEEPQDETEEEMQ